LAIICYDLARIVEKMKSKKSKKTKLNLFQEVDFKPKSAEMAVLVLICAGVFGISFFGGWKPLYDYSQKKERAVLGSQPETPIVQSAIAAEDQAEKNTAGAADDILLKKNKNPAALFIEVNPAQDQANREERAKAIARRRAAEIALINSAPILAGPTTKLANGKRACSLKNPHPSGRGGKPHIDEDCCADYDEYPNPRCEYPPEQMAAFKKK
jgi:hypothetical protein